MNFVPKSETVEPEFINSFQYDGKIIKFILISVLFYLTDNVTLYTFYSCLIWVVFWIILRQLKCEFLGNLPT